MATRQYIGARYTVLVYENSGNPASAEWKSGVTYEPLTLVTYNNSSYLSKKTVPSNIGNPAANSSYWVCTGYYNGQILTLDQKIDDEIAHREYEDLKIVHGTAKHYVFFGDSYLKGYNAGGEVENFVTRCANKYPVDLRPEFLRSAVNGAGFTSNTKKFSDMVDEFTGSGLERITDVFFTGGYNDRTASEGDILNEINLTVTKCHTKFPNARIHLLWLALDGADAQRTENLVSRAAYWRRGCTYGATFTNGAKWWHNFADDFNPSDPVHPNAQGQSDIALGLYNLLNGYDDYTERVSTQRIVYTQGTNLNFNVYQLNDNIDFDFEWTNYTDSVSFAPRDWTKIGDVVIKGLFKGSPQPIGDIMVKIGSTFYMMAVRVYEDELQLYNYEASAISSSSCIIPKQHFTLPILRY